MEFYLNPSPEVIREHVVNTAWDAAIAANVTRDALILVVKELAIFQSENFKNYNLDDTTAHLIANECEKLKIEIETERGAFETYTSVAGQIMTEIDSPFAV